MTCYFQLLKLSSCHSNKCSRCLHSSQDNIYDSIKDTHSLPRVNNDRWFSVFLRKGVSVFSLPSSEQLSFIALSWGREGRRGEEGEEVEVGKIQGLFWLEFKDTAPATLRIALSSFSPGSSLPPACSLFHVTFDGNETASEEAFPPEQGDTRFALSVWPTVLEVLQV